VRGHGTGVAGSGSVPGRGNRALTIIIFFFFFFFSFFISFKFVC